MNDLRFTFRPFNFRAGDPARRNHAVQYVALPTHDWQKLRREQPEKCEQPLAPAPDPNGRFHVRVVVAHPKVGVFVNDAAEPCLVVEQLSDRKTGWVGFWVGNGSGGEFANLKITPREPSPESAMNTILNTSQGIVPKIVRQERFLVMGTLTGIRPGTESGEMFASIWNDFEAHRERIKPHSTDQKYYGVSFAASTDGRLDYLAGMAITPPQKIPDGLVVREVPTATYAVFACPVAAIGPTKRYVFAEWHSKSGYQVDTAAPAFEEYPRAEDTESPVLIHIPICEKQMK